MAIFYDELGEKKRCENINDENYEKYISKFNELESNYNRLRDNYNGEIAVINTERVSMREEIKKLYEYLNTIGGNIGEAKTIFDFKMELSAIYKSFQAVVKIQPPILENTHLFLDSLIKTVSIKNSNKRKIEDFELEIDGKEIEYTNSLEEIKQNIKFLNEANEIAKIYKEIIIIIRDEIKDRIIPEFGLIRAFLYADDIKEKLINDMDPTDIQPHSIEEYNGSLQNIHYQFIKNAFDFYNIVVNFFQRTILTDIISDCEITDSEEIEFYDDVSNIKDFISKLNQLRTLKDE